MTMERQSLETALRQGSLTGLLRARSFPRGMNLWHWTKTVGGCVSPLLLLLQHWMAMVIPLKVVPIQIPKANSPAGKQVLEWEWRGGGQGQYLASSPHLLLVPVELCACFHYCPYCTACCDLFMGSPTWWTMMSPYLILLTLPGTSHPVLRAQQVLDKTIKSGNDQRLTLGATFLW